MQEQPHDELTQLNQRLAAARGRTIKSVVERLGIDDDVTVHRLFARAIINLDNAIQKIREEGGDLDGSKPAIVDPLIHHLTEVSTHPYLTEPNILPDEARAIVRLMLRRAEITRNNVIPFKKK
ncbi:hypothetical protein A2853_01845 [Candidatus Kaiserbacteria bacterium RIFCSPHIGHO2_01_FULL_55_17]|uniref:Uncharacterized protein n=1 Tax=Candidatus Kaiserbacteria bacterium RIFCSPHIGHO2_01_FULL_55_17 TaxID=1798484 RepID=A0A1F6D905_9BACT|nr:MAG: hypothetical protein A2853_01845 [Candidatus Kaiserbacteria bacterium RIFCSPHIGHO2_01_FULL_55_17]